MISYLPLSHVAAQMMDIHAPLHTGLTIHFAQPDALKGSLAITLRVRRSHDFIGVCVICVMVYFSRRYVRRCLWVCPECGRNSRR